MLYRDKSIANVVELSTENDVEFFIYQKKIIGRIGDLNTLGLDYRKLGHPSTILSGVAGHRGKLAAESGKLKRSKYNLYILDKTTTELHFTDIDRMLDCLHRLVGNGNGMVVIEHNLDVIKIANHIIDSGSEGGHKGGELTACGTPEDIATDNKSRSGQFLAGHLEAKDDACPHDLSVSRWHHCTIH